MKHLTFERHVSEIVQDLKEHLHFQNILKAKAALIGCAGLKMLLAQSLFLKVVAAQLLFVKAAVVKVGVAAMLMGTGITFTPQGTLAMQVCDEGGQYQSMQECIPSCQGGQCLSTPGADPSSSFVICNSCPTIQPEVCDNQIDDDQDGDIDCADSECLSDQRCGSSIEINCFDSIDNDNDQAVDCEDSDCFGDSQCNTQCDPVSCGSQGAQCGLINDGCGGMANCGTCGGNQFCEGNLCNTCLPFPCPAPQEGCMYDVSTISTDSNGCDISCGEMIDIETGLACGTVLPEICNDNQDNDNDGLVDCNDNDCDGDSLCSSVDTYEVLCNDGLDNDNDGNIDCSDSDCSSSQVCGCGSFLGACLGGRTVGGVFNTTCGQPDRWQCIGLQSGTDVECEIADPCDGTCLPIDCAAPPVGCTYNPNTIQYSSDGCPVSCGELIGNNGLACDFDQGPTSEICNDQIDNDRDGAIDCMDDDCDGFTDGSTDCGPFGGGGDPQCSISACLIPGEVLNQETCECESQGSLSIQAEGLSNVSVVPGTQFIDAINFDIISMMNTPIQVNALSFKQKMISSSNLADYDSLITVNMSLRKNTAQGPQLIQALEGAELGLNRISGTYEFDAHDGIIIPADATQNFLLTVDVTSNQNYEGKMFEMELVDVDISGSNGQVVCSYSPDKVCNQNTTSITSDRIITVIQEGMLTVHLNNDQANSFPQSIVAGTQEIVARVDFMVMNEAVTIEDIAVNVSGEGTQQFQDAVFEVVLFEDDYITEIQRDTVTSTQHVFNNIDLQLVEGMQSLYIGIMSNEIGSSGDGVHMEDIQLSISVQDVEGINSADTIRVKYEGNFENSVNNETNKSQPFNIVPVKIADIEMINQAGSIIADTEIQTTGDTVLGVIQITTDDWNTTTQQGETVALLIDDINFDIVTSSSITTTAVYIDGEELSCSTSNGVITDFASCFFQGAEIGVATEHTFVVSADFDLGATTQGGFVQLRVDDLQTQGVVYSSSDPLENTPIHGVRNGLKDSIEGEFITLGDPDINIVSITKSNNQSPYIFPNQRTFTLGEIELSGISDGLGVSSIAIDVEINNTNGSCDSAIDAYTLYNSETGVFHAAGNPIAGGGGSGGSTGGGGSATCTSYHTYTWSGLGSISEGSKLLLQGRSKIDENSPILPTDGSATNIFTEGMDGQKIQAEITDIQFTDTTYTANPSTVLFDEVTAKYSPEGTVGALSLNVDTSVSQEFDLFTYTINIDDINENGINKVLSIKIPEGVCVLQNFDVAITEFSYDNRATRLGYEELPTSIGMNPICGFTDMRVIYPLLDGTFQAGYGWSELSFVKGTTQKEEYCTQIVYSADNAQYEEYNHCIQAVCDNGVQEFTERCGDSCNDVSACGDIGDISWYGNDEFLDALSWAYGEGLTSFSTVDTFKPDQLMTKESAAKFISAYAVQDLCLEPDTSLNCNYADLDAVQPQFKEYVNLACQLGIFDNITDTFSQSSAITHADFITALIKAIRISSGEDPMLDENVVPPYLHYYQEAKDIGLISETDPFALNLVISRGDIIIMLYRARIDGNSCQQQGSDDITDILDNLFTTTEAKLLDITKEIYDIDDELVMLLQMLTASNQEQYIINDLEDVVTLLKIKNDELVEILEEISSNGTPAGTNLTDILEDLVNDNNAANAETASLLTQLFSQSNEVDQQLSFLLDELIKDQMSTNNDIAKTLFEIGENTAEDEIVYAVLINGLAQNADDTNSSLEAILSEIFTNVEAIDYDFATSTPTIEVVERNETKATIKSTIVLAQSASKLVPVESYTISVSQIIDQSLLQTDPAQAVGPAVTMNISPTVIERGKGVFVIPGLDPSVSYYVQVSPDLPSSNDLFEELTRLLQLTSAGLIIPVHQQPQNPTQDNMTIEDTIGEIYDDAATNGGTTSPVTQEEKQEILDDIYKLKRSNDDEESIVTLLLELGNQQDNLLFIEGILNETTNPDELVDEITPQQIEVLQTALGNIEKDREARLVLLIQNRPLLEQEEIQERIEVLKTSFDDQEELQEILEYVNTPEEVETLKEDTTKLIKEVRVEQFKERIIELSNTQDTQSPLVEQVEEKIINTLDIPKETVVDMINEAVKGDIQARQIIQQQVNSKVSADTLAPQQALELLDELNSDEDKDGIADIVEDSAPNAGDANFDGIQDKTQEGVATIPATQGETTKMTIDMEQDSACGDVVTFASSSETSIGVSDSTYNYPVGLNKFEVNCDEATIRVFYHGLTLAELSAMEYRKFSVTQNQYINLPATYAELNGVPYAVFTIADGSVYDDSPAGDGRIVDDNGPATGGTDSGGDTDSDTESSSGSGRGAHSSINPEWRKSYGGNGNTGTAAVKKKPTPEEEKTEEEMRRSKIQISDTVYLKPTVQKEEKKDKEEEEKTHEAAPVKSVVAPFDKLLSLPMLVKFEYTKVFAGNNLPVFMYIYDTIAKMPAEKQLGALEIVVNKLKTYSEDQLRTYKIDKNIVVTVLEYIVTCTKSSCSVSIIEGDKNSITTVEVTKEIEADSIEENEEEVIGSGTVVEEPNTDENTPNTSVGSGTTAENNDQQQEQKALGTGTVAHDEAMIGSGETA